MGNAKDDIARIERADSAYRNVKRGAGIVALVIGVTYGTVVGLAMADGDRTGIELPAEIATAWVGVFVVLALLSAGAWLLEQGNYVSAHRVLVPALREAVRGELAAQTPIVARGVAQVVSSGLEMQVRTAANRAGDRTVAALRAELTTDLTEIINAGLGRAQRYGMTRQALAQADGGANSHGTRVLYPVREVPQGD